ADLAAAGPESGWHGRSAGPSRARPLSQDPVVSSGGPWGGCSAWAGGATAAASPKAGGEASGAAGGSAGTALERSGEAVEAPSPAAPRRLFFSPAGGGARAAG
ncbi:unnamed protein product, partial [Prorocentrum cordatum]